MPTPTDVRLSVLDSIRVASPCPMRWDDMDGGDRIRHCRQCDLDVYNIADLTADEAEALIATHQASGERLCAVLHRRSDGTVITRDCPVGLRALRKRAVRRICRLAAALGLLVTGGALLGATHRRTAGPDPLRTLNPFKPACKALTPNRPVAPVNPPIAGEIWIPPPNGSDTNGGGCGTTGDGSVGTG